MIPLEKIRYYSSENKIRTRLNPIPLALLHLSLSHLYEKSPSVTVAELLCVRAQKEPENSQGGLDSPRYPNRDVPPGAL